MTANCGGELERLRPLFASSEPPELRRYLAVAEPGRRYLAGTTTPLIGSFVRLATGLWVPEKAKIEPAPLDFARVYTALSEVTGDVLDLRALRHVLARLPMRQSILAIAATMATIRDPRMDGIDEIDKNSLVFFKEPARSVLANRLAQGAIIHAPQLLMILEKLVIAWCPDHVPAEQMRDIPLALLLMAVADNLSSTLPDEAEDGGTLLSHLSVELAANHHFNARYDTDSQLALFQRRWIEMPREAPSSYHSAPLEDTFFDLTGARLSDHAIVAMALIAGCLGGRVSVSHDYFSNLGWEPDRLEAVMKLITLPVDRYRQAVKDELADHALEWYFTTFARFPLIEIDGQFVVLDPELLLRRCLGWLPFYDMDQKLRDEGHNAEASRIRNALNAYSERYVCEAFGSLTSGVRTGRIYFDQELRRAFKGREVADVAIDYGDSWVVAETSTRQIARDTVNAVSISGIVKDRDAIAEEATQVAKTINAIRREEQALTGRTRANRTRFFPLVILTEGFPNNPVMTTIIREELASRGLLQEPDTAPLEILDIVELDMIEGIAERGGPSLPEILRRKASSHFHADSIRNFLLADSRFQPHRPERVNAAFRRVFDYIAAALGIDKSAFDRSDGGASQL